jgi:hypothetical protein
MSENTYVTNIYIGGKSERTFRFNYAIGKPMRKQSGGNMLDLTITDEQKVKVTVNPVTEAGSPVTLDGPIIVEISSGDGAYVVEPDGISVYLISGQPGDTVYTISGDADLGAGVVNVTDLVTLHVEGAMAAALGLIAGEPELK